MTELNQQADRDAQAVSAHWPSLPTSTPADASAGTPLQGTGDPDVDGLLGLLSAVPGMTVPEHGAVYAELHDALLEALNAEPSSEPADSSDPVDPSTQDTSRP